MKRSKRKSPPVVLDVERIANRADEVIADVDELVAQLRKMVEDHTDGYER